MKHSNWLVWTIHHTWVIPASYLVSMIFLVIVHGSFGFSMNDPGNYLSNALMHIVSGAILAAGTGLLQMRLLNRVVPISYLWIISLVSGFILAESIAGIVLWKQNVYRGLINTFNTNHHLPEAAIFACAGFIAGMFQVSQLKAFGKSGFYWIASSTLGWAVFILSAYLGIFALLLGSLLYGMITGYAYCKVLELIKPTTNGT